MTHSKKDTMHDDATLENRFPSSFPPFSKVGGDILDSSRELSGIYFSSWIYANHRVFQVHFAIVWFAFVLKCYVGVFDRLVYSPANSISFSSGRIDSFIYRRLMGVSGSSATLSRTKWIHFFLKSGFYFILTSSSTTICIYYLGIFCKKNFDGISLWRYDSVIFFLYVIPSTLFDLTISRWIPNKEQWR